LSTAAVGACDEPTDAVGNSGRITSAGAIRKLAFHDIARAQTEGLERVPQGSFELAHLAHQQFTGVSRKRRRWLSSVLTCIATGRPSSRAQRDAHPCDRSTGEALITTPVPLANHADCGHMQQHIQPGVMFHMTCSPYFPLGREAALFPAAFRAAARYF